MLTTFLFPLLTVLPAEPSANLTLEHLTSERRLRLTSGDGSATDRFQIEGVLRKPDSTGFRFIAESAKGKCAVLFLTLDGYPLIQFAEDNLLVVNTESDGPEFWLIPSVCFRLRWGVRANGEATHFELYTMRKQGNLRSGIEIDMASLVNAHKSDQGFVSIAPGSRRYSSSDGRGTVSIIVPKRRFGRGQFPIQRIDFTKRDGSTLTVGNIRVGQQSFHRSILRLSTVESANLGSKRNIDALVASALKANMKAKRAGDAMLDGLTRVATLPRADRNAMNLQIDRIKQESVDEAATAFSIVMRMLYEHVIFPVSTKTIDGELKHEYDYDRNLTSRLLEIQYGPTICSKLFACFRDVICDEESHAELRFLLLDAIAKVGTPVGSEVLKEIETSVDARKSREDERLLSAVRVQLNQFDSADIVVLRRCIYDDEASWPTQALALEGLVVSNTIRADDTPRVRKLLSNENIAEATGDAVFALGIRGQFPRRID